MEKCGLTHGHIPSNLPFRRLVAKKPTFEWPIVGFEGIFRFFHLGTGKAIFRVPQIALNSNFGTFYPTSRAATLGLS